MSPSGFVFSVFYGALYMRLALGDHRLEEFERISNHELLYVDVSQFVSADIIEFDAFGHHYRVQLEVNEHMNPLFLRHTKGNPSELDDNLHQIYTHLTESCHYFGKVVNTDESVVAVSMCDHHGIRGQITAFGETIVIRPANYYLDPEFDSTQSHQFTDQHLVFKLSDLAVDHTMVDVVVNDEIDDTLNTNTAADGGRRRMAIKKNGGKNYVELALLIGPYRVAAYQDAYPGTWYDQLVLDHTGIVNTASSSYASTDWGGRINFIQMVFVEIEIIDRFAGDYAYLAPKIKPSTCKDLMNTANCGIDMDDYIERLKWWVYDHKDTGTFDDLQMFMNMPQDGPYAGIAFKGTMCKGYKNVGYTVVSSLSYAASTLTHEIGHNFDLSHDGQKGDASDCGENAGLMGYGNKRPLQTFSSCSKRKMDAFFKPLLRNLRCLKYRKQTARRTNYRQECIAVKGTGNSNLNGEYKQYSRHNAKYSFKKGSYYLYWVRPINSWIVSGRYGGYTDIRAACRQEQIEDCAKGKWDKNYAAGAYVESCVPDTQPDGNKCRNDVTACVTISGLDHRIKADSLNGQWRAMNNKCHEGENVYELKSPNSPTYYMYRYKPFWWWKRKWYFSDTIGSESITAWCKPFEMDGCTNDMNVWLGDHWRHDRSVRVIKSCAAAFEVDCMEDDHDTLGSGLCVSNKNTYDSWGIEGEALFEVFNECSNENKVFYHTFNETTTYYLHYNEYNEYSGSNVTSGRWIITINELLAIPVTMCENEDLLECVAGEWIFNGKTGEDLELEIYDEFMAIKNERCGAEKGDTKTKSSGNGGIIILGSLAGALVIGLIVLFCVCSRLKMSNALKTKDAQYSLMETDVYVETK
eukprot:118634_1